ncbi:type I restriction enzyme, S subunit [Nonomuraea solani]|uniref:Type I restriction enzyme, S subunit n=2 Tax=Nonomuraea solani TaxID=1144553 RepID=A0A1H6EX08_9ACTN|nr:type I restriction enzyme, S subunit [Nonomuraea solani]
MRLDIQRTPMRPATTYRLAGVLNAGQGLVAKGEIDGGGTEYSAMNVLRVDQVVMRKLTAWEGPITVVPAEFDGFVVSNEFPTFTLGPELVPAWMRHVCRSPRLWAEMKNRVSGTVQRRKRLNPEQLLQIELPIPPREVQARIVEILDAVDDQITALDSEANTARKLLHGVLAEHFATVKGERRRIVDLCSHVVGGVWGNPEGEGEVDRLALGPRIYAPGTSDFVTDGSPVRSFTSKQAGTRTVQEQDIILERSGGSPEQPVGRVVIAGSDLEPCVPTDFQRLIRVDPQKVSPRYVFWRLRHDWASGLTYSYSRRTTGITNLSVKEYIAREVPLPALEEQTGLTESAEAVDALVATLRTEAVRLRQARAGLLAGLLDRTIDIKSAELEG